MDFKFPVKNWWDSQHGFCLVVALDADPFAQSVVWLMLAAGLIQQVPGSVRDTQNKMC